MGVHIGAIWRKRVNRPCAAAMRLMSDYFDHLFAVESTELDAKIQWWADDQTVSEHCSVYLVFTSLRYNRPI